MNRISPLLFAALVSACNTPHPDFRGRPATHVMVEGSVFAVRIRGLRAEAIRINPQYAPRFGPIRRRAALAMQQVSGCKVASISGDQAQAFGRLDCGSGPPPKRRNAIDVDCVPIRGSEIPEIGQLRIELDCSPA